MIAAEITRPDVAAKRAVWQEALPDMDPARLVFIDETWAKTNMTPSHGRSLRGQRLRMDAPFGHWQTTTFLAALRHDGITAPCVLNHPMNRISFESWVEQFLAPTLKSGDIVVMDNLSSHKSERTRKIIESCGAELRFLPPYSPDFNPIEQVFAKLKALLRKAKERTRETLWNRIGDLLDCFTPKECRNYITAAGYGENLNG